MIYSAAILIVGFQAVVFSLLTKLYAAREGFLPPGRRFLAFSNWLTLERGIFCGLGIFILGTAAAIVQFVAWGSDGFGDLNTFEAMRVAIPGMLGLVLGFQTAMASIFAGTFSIATRATSGI